MYAIQNSQSVKDRDGAQVAAPLKVLFFYLDYGAVGGIERYILNVASSLKKRGQVEPLVVCSEGGQLQKDAIAAGLETYGVQGTPWLAGSVWRMFDFAALGQLRRILKQIRPDVVHVHIGLLENLWLRWLGYPTVYTVHGYSTLYSMDGVTHPLKRLWKKAVRFLFRETTRRMDALLFVSEAERRRMLEEGYITDSHPAEVIQNGIDLQRWRQKIRMADTVAIREQLGLPQDARVVSFINRLDPNKNPLQFVALARQLLEDPAFRGTYFLIAGDGPLMGLTRLQALASEQIVVLGYYPEVSDLLAVSDLVVYPSLKEGFGLGLLEAMGVGKPCLSYANGGATELLGHPDTESCLAPLGDFEALVQKVKTFLNNEPENLRSALMRRAEAYDLPRMLERLERVYNRQRPVVSVILPVYQGEDIVLRAVTSVLRQTYPRLELIVVDDGSTDGTVTQLEGIRDKRLRILRQQNQGVAAARNAGFRQAQGDYIAFIDADDIWLPNKLEEELRVAQSAGQPCIVYSAYYAVDEALRLVNLPAIRTYAGQIFEAALSDEGLFLPSTSLIHRAVFEHLQNTAGGFQGACYHEDRVFFLRAAKVFPAFPTGKRLVLYQQSLSGRCRRILSNYKQALEAELSITNALQDVFDASELEQLARLQLKNLTMRFLMYGYLDSARKVAQALSERNTGGQRLFIGLKGSLTQWSLRFGVNFLMLSRLVLQWWLYPLLTPWWFLRMQTFKQSHAPQVKADSSTPLSSGVPTC